MTTNLSRYKYDIKKIRHAAHGNWPDILSGLGIPKHYLRNKHGPCPGCGGHDRFRFDDQRGNGEWICGGGGRLESGDGFKLLQHALSYSFVESLEAVSNYLRLPVNSEKNNIVKPSHTCTESNQILKKRRKYLRKTWKNSLPPDHIHAEPLRKYMINRGLSEIIDDWPNSLLYCSSLAYYENNTMLGNFPAMISVVSDSKGDPVTLHRTYLTESGHKAPVPNPKKLMSPLYQGAINGGAIRLYPATGSLAIAEGVETALAIRVATKMPVWATLSAGGMKSILIPLDIKRIFIMADKDRNQTGAIAAYQLQVRLISESRDARVILPRQNITEGQKGIDWLDALNSGRISND